MPLLDPQVSAKIGTLQALDDAIAFRLGRLNLPCPDCTADQKCIDHACDLELIAGYQDRYAAVFREALADMDPDDIEQVMQPGDGTPPTVGVLSAAVLARLSARQCAVPWTWPARRRCWTGSPAPGPGPARTCGS